MTRFLAVVLAAVVAAPGPGAADSGTWGISGNALLVGDASESLGVEFSLSGTTLGERSGAGYALVGMPAEEVVFACVDSRREGALKVLATGLGSDGRAYELDLSHSDAGTEIVLTRGAPGAECAVAGPSTTFRNVHDDVRSGENGLIRVAGSASTATFAVTVDVVTSQWQLVRGDATVTVGSGPAAQLDVVCTKYEPRGADDLWLTIVGFGPDGTGYEIFIHDRRRWTRDAADLMALDLGMYTDLAPNCSLGGNSTPQTVVSGDLVSTDPV